METQTKPELTRGEKYIIELYPGDTIVNGNYIGENGEKHVFDGEGIYIFVDNNWITDKNGVITHKSISSFSVNTIKKGKIDKESKLINILRNLKQI